MNLPGLELSQTAQHWTNVVLIWLGLGIVAGLLARFILPGHRPAGAAGTLLVGIIGSTIGPLALSLFHAEPAATFNPISPLGIFAAIGGSVAALAVYRLFLLWRISAWQEDETLE
ncbi:MAG: GlsB/YeaQ/YmgE family stress response membrane protein [Thermoguttaceae bacterium]|jgi:uncharacterized membrane protein YeaQ/YmgE (transglycosylase-associated protein family)|nr:GlsB/YeaQ/YmgE family stress response membrane protein [Thermoguttaceae bacterium]